MTGDDENRLYLYNMLYADLGASTELVRRTETLFYVSENSRVSRHAC